MKQITIQCNLDGSTSWVDKDQYTILSNENNATQVTIRFPPAYSDYKKMFDIFVGYDKTGNTEPAILSRTTGDTLTFVLDNSYMKKGYIHIQPIATKAVSGQSVDDTVKWKVVAQIPVRTSLDITEDTTTPSVVTSLENYINAEIADLDASLAIKAVNVTTLEAGASATGSMVREVDGLTLSLGIPTGAKIVSAGFDEADLVFTLDDGSTVSIASLTFSGLRPPARNTGQETCSRIFRLSFQLWTRPVPPSSFISRFGLPLSIRIASTDSESITASSIEASLIT